MALMQDGKPIEYASRSLTDTEQRWAQIEKEMLAVVCGLERFDQYTFGRKVTVINDHKPLDCILKKPMNQAPLRLQKLLMRAYRYDFTFQWIHGSQLKLADYLSRDCQPTQPAPETDDTMACRQISSRIPDTIIEKVRLHTSNDNNLKTLIETIQNGWPECKSQITAAIRPYYDFRDTLSAEDGIILKGERILIPVTMRTEIKEKLHSAHLAYDSMMRRAKEAVFWPSMAADIREMTDKCETCQSMKPSNQRETLVQHVDESDQPWEKIACDLMEISGRHYLVTVDYYSNFIEVDYVPSMTTNIIITKLKGHFARFGIPKIVITDSGSQFVSQEFQTFALTWGFIHKASSPGHHQSNGKAEAAVKIVKNMMRKANNCGQDQYAALLELRNTPRQHSESPTQLMLRRRARTMLPSLNTTNRPNTYSPTRSQSNHKRSTSHYQQVKQSYDRRSKDLPRLKHNQPVYYQNPERREWKRGKITNQEGARRYRVEGENGAVYTRNRVHLRPRHSQFQRDINFDNDSCSYTTNNENRRMNQNDTNATNGDNAAPNINVRRSVREKRQPAWFRDFEM